MKLSTRLSLFFLGALAAVLLGFSAALFALTSRYLHRQIDERLDAALNTLGAAAEVGPDGLEWEPHERTLVFGRHTLEGPFLWRVSDDLGRRLDGSSPGDPDHVLGDPREETGRRSRSIADSRGTTWCVMRRRLPEPDGDGDPRESPAPPPGLHASLYLSAAVSLEGLQGTLRNLALVLTGLSAGLWTLALVCGRRLSHRALRPVTTMAQAAHAISGDALDQRLPVLRTDDELEELGRSINGLLDRLHDSFERQRRFTGDASHQLRTPLTAIQGQVDLALRQDRDIQEYKRVLSVVQRKTRHLRQIVEALLFLARSDEETLSPPLEPIDLGFWLTDHLQAWQETRQGTDLRFEIEPDSRLSARVHPALLAELLNNLLDNAARYGVPGAPITVSLGFEAGSAALAVADQGMGIAQDEISHVFEPFYRSPAARERGALGLGLGLSIAARLAASFGASLDVSSQVGRGSRFTLRLPTDSARRPDRDPQPAAKASLAAP